MFSFLDAIDYLEENTDQFKPTPEEPKKQVATPRKIERENSTNESKRENESEGITNGTPENEQIDDDPI